MANIVPYLAQLKHQICFSRPVGVKLLQHYYYIIVIITVPNKADYQVSSFFLEILKRLGALGKEAGNKPDPELGKLMAKLGEDEGIKNFLNGFPGPGKSLSSLKRGVCK